MRFDGDAAVGSITAACVLPRASTGTCTGVRIAARGDATGRASGEAVPPCGARARLAMRLGEATSRSRPRTDGRRLERACTGAGRAGAVVRRGADSGTGGAPAGAAVAGWPSTAGAVAPGAGAADGGEPAGTGGA
jgi:hypothetical protein